MLSFVRSPLTAMLLASAALALGPTTLPSAAALPACVSEGIPPTDGAPAAPTNCQAGVSYDGRLTWAVVTWSDNSNNEDGFIVEWRRSRPRDNGLETLPADTTSTWLFAGYSGSKNQFRVKAFNEAGESRWSNWATLTVP